MTVSKLLQKYKKSDDNTNVGLNLFPSEEVAALFSQNTPKAYAKQIEKYLNR